MIMSVELIKFVFLPGAMESASGLKNTIILLILRLLPILLTRHFSAPFFYFFLSPNINKSKKMATSVGQTGKEALTTCFCCWHRYAKIPSHI
jgi:hypothetical protein